jgi:hypothetical protein
MEDCKDLDRALAMARRALTILEEQAAGFGALHVPAHLKIELEEKRRQVAELEAKMNQTLVAASPVAEPVATATLRQMLQRLDDVELDALCLDHFPAVYDRFSRGLRRDEKINLLLNHCRRNPEDAARLTKLL